MHRPTKRVKLQSHKANAVRSPLPLPAACIIATYLNPYQLLTVSRVSRLWHSLFASDQAWEHLDVYGVGRSICNHYLQSKEMCEQDEWDCQPGKLRRVSPNFYHHLVRLREDSHLYPPEQLHLAPKSLFKCLLKTNKVFGNLDFDVVPWIYQKDKNLVYALLRKGFGTGSLIPEYKKDRTAALCATSYASFDNFYDSDESFDIELLKDYEVALHAVSLNWREIYCVPEWMLSDKQIFLAHLPDRAGNPDDMCDDPFWDASENLRSDRELVLDVLRDWPHGLNSISDELKNDWEVVWTALSSIQYPNFYKQPMPTLSPSILANRDHVLSLLDLKWVLPLDRLSPQMWADEEVLEIYVERAKTLIQRSSMFCWLERRLVALSPLYVAKDYDYILDVLKLEDPTVDECPTLFDMGLKLREQLGNVPSQVGSSSGYSSPYSQSSVY